MQELLDKLNELNVSEWDNDGQDLIYVCVDDTQENRNSLATIGANEEDFVLMKEGFETENVLDLVTFACEKLGANYYIHGIGFIFNHDE